MCIQGACEHRRAAAHPTQCRGSFCSHMRPAHLLSRSLALSAHTRRKSGVRASGSAAQIAQPSPAPLATPALPELGLTSGPPARRGQESSTQPLHHQGVTHRLMKSHSPLQNVTNQSKTKTKKRTGEHQRKVVVLGKCLAASSFASKQYFAQNVSIFFQNAIELSLK